MVLSSFLLIKSDARITNRYINHNHLHNYYLNLLIEIKGRVVETQYLLYTGMCYN